MELRSPSHASKLGSATDSLSSNAWLWESRYPPTATTQSTKLCHPERSPKIGVAFDTPSLFHPFHDAMITTYRAWTLVCAGFHIFYPFTHCLRVLSLSLLLSFLLFPSLCLSFSPLPRILVPLQHPVVPIHISCHVNRWVIFLDYPSIYSDHRTCFSVHRWRRHQFSLFHILNRLDSLRPNFELFFQAHAVMTSFVTSYILNHCNCS